MIAQKENLGSTLAIVRPLKPLIPGTLHRGSRLASPRLHRGGLPMARTVVVICLMAFGWPMAVLADSLGPVFLGNHLLTVGGVVPADEGLVSPESDVLAAGVVVPSEEIGLLSPAATEENTTECLRTSAGSERPNGCLDSAGSGAGLQVGEPLEQI